MARFLSRALIHESQTLTLAPSPVPSSSSSSILLQSTLRSRFLAVRWRSGRAGKSSPAVAASQVEVVEIEADVTSAGELRLGMKRLEDAIHSVIVRRAAPDWLPFVPGSSYWVPPRGAALGLVELVGKLANPLTQDEAMSLTTARGWPSRTYFLEGASPQPAKKGRRKITAAQSDDEDS